MSEAPKRRWQSLGTLAGVFGVLWLTLQLPGCWLRPFSGNLHRARYASGVEFDGRDVVKGEQFYRVYWRRQMPNQILPFVIEAEGRTFGADDLQFDAFQAAGAKVPVTEYFEGKGEQKRIRIHELHGTLELSGKNFKLWCRYAGNNDLKYVDMLAWDLGTLPDGAESFSVEWNGKTLSIPCSLEELKKQMGEPQSLDTYSLGM